MLATLKISPILSHSVYTCRKPPNRTSSLVPTGKQISQNMIIFKNAFKKGKIVKNIGLDQMDKFFAASLKQPAAFWFLLPKKRVSPN